MERSTGGQDATFGVLVGMISDLRPYPSPILLDGPVVQASSHASVLYEFLRAHFTSQKPGTQAWSGKL